VAFGQFIFTTGWKFPAYYWPWMILGRGFGHRGAYLKSEYRSFSLARNLLRLNLENKNQLAASLSAFSLLQIYKKHHRHLKSVDTLTKKSVDQWSLEEMQIFLQEADEKPAVYQGFNNSLNETANIWAGAFLTTILGMGFIATTMNIVDFQFAIIAGAAGLLIFPTLTGAISLFDRIMRRTGDPMIRAAKASNAQTEMERAPAYQLSAIVQAQRAEELVNLRLAQLSEDERSAKELEINTRYDALLADIKTVEPQRVSPLSKVSRSIKAAGKALVTSCRKNVVAIGSTSAPTGE
jgi:hypothetical protein